MIIYRWENKINGKNYIGKWEGRLNKLIYRYNKEIKDLSIKNRAVINSMRFYGLNQFELKIVHEDNKLNTKELEDLERFYIREFKSLTIENGYNCTRGGDGGDVYSFRTKEQNELTRKKLSGKIPWNKGKKGVMPTPWNKGKTLPEETKARISKTLTGKKLTAETKEKMSKTHKNRKLYNRVLFTEEEMKFIIINIKLGRRALRAKFNKEFKTNYSDAPFIRMKKFYA